MKTTTCLAIRRPLILSILLLLSTAVLTAQIQIKSRVEIAPKKTYSYHTNSSSSDFPCFTGEIDPASDVQKITVLRRCIVTASGSLTCSDPTNLYPYLYNYEINNKTITFYIECGRIIEAGDDGAPFSCGAIQLPCNATGFINDNSAEFDISGVWYCIYPRTSLIYMTFRVSAVPTQNPDTLIISAYPEILDAYENLYQFQEGSDIIGVVLDQNKEEFQFCGEGTMSFSIENPRPGVTIYGSPDSGPHSSSSLMWDGSDLPSGVDTMTIFVKANYKGFMGTQGVLLKKVVPHHFTVTPDKYPIYVGDSDTVRAIAKNSNDEEVFLDGGKSITFFDESGTGSFIIGSDTIPTQITVTYDQAKSGIVKYYSKPGASNLVNEQYIWIDVFRTEYPERIGYGLIDVMPACPLVSLSPSKISPGDKTTITVMAQTVDGVFLYPSDQKFIASMNADPQYGKLRCISTEEEGSYLSGKQPFEFIAADSLNVDSIVINIKVTPVSGSANASSIKDGQKDTLQRQAVLEKKITPSKKGTVPSEGDIKNTLTLKQASVPKKLTEEMNALAQKAAKKQALMNAITEAIKTQKEGKGDAASAKQLKAMVQELAEGDLCMLFAILTIKGPELVLDYPTEDQIIEGNKAPVWTKSIRARLENYDKGSVTFYWDMKVEWNGDAIYTPIADNIYQNDKDKPINGTNDNWVDLDIKTDKPLLGGDQVTLHVKAVADGKSYETNPAWLEIFQIKGRNPSKASILAALGDDKYRAIAQHESKYNQFHIRDYGTFDGVTPAYPYQGVEDPSDIGIMQIHNPEQYQNGDAIVWDWTVNVQQGKDIFILFYKNTNNYLKSLSGLTTFTDEQLLKETYCEYNKGFFIHYWQWNKPDDNYGKAGYLSQIVDGTSLEKKGRKYGNEVWGLYNAKSW